MLEKYFVHPCTIYRQSNDEYADKRSNLATSTKCWYREIEEHQKVGDIREEKTSDAMAWVKSGENIQEGDFMTVGGKSYKVIQLVEARRLGETRVQFTKVFLERFDSFVS